MRETYMTEDFEWRSLEFENHLVIIPVSKVLETQDGGDIYYFMNTWNEEWLPREAR